MIDVQRRYSQAEPAAFWAAAAAAFWAAWAADEAADEEAVAEALLHAPTIAWPTVLAFVRKLFIDARSLVIVASVLYVHNIMSMCSCIWDVNLQELTCWSC